MIGTYYWSLDIVDFLNIILCVIYILFKNMKEKCIQKVFLNFMEMKNQKYLLWVFHCVWNQIYFDAQCFENGNMAKCQNTSCIFFISSCPGARIVPYIVRTIYQCEVICFKLNYFSLKFKTKIPTPTPTLSF